MLKLAEIIHILGRTASASRAATAVVVVILVILDKTLPLPLPHLPIKPCAKCSCSDHVMQCGLDADKRSCLDQTQQLPFCRNQSNQFISPLSGWGGLVWCFLPAPFQPGPLQKIPPPQNKTSASGVEKTTQFLFVFPLSLLGVFTKIWVGWPDF